MKKILVISGSRAEWGLLSPLVVKLYGYFNVEVVATGSHLSPIYGNTINNIKEDLRGVAIPVHKVEIVLANDSATAISKSMGLVMISFGELYQRTEPDLIVVLGDRWEIAAACMSANLFNIPIAHIHGGERTDGSYDDKFRNAITMLSDLHFPVCKEYENRIYKMIMEDFIPFGDSRLNIFNVGALGCEGLEKRKQDEKYNGIVVCIYPETDGDNNLEDILIFVNRELKLPIRAWINPNCDRGSFEIRRISGELFSSFNRNQYIKLISESIAIVGNSSSGIIEAPVLGVPTINIGSRQKGRLMADSIIQADATVESIEKAFDKLYSDEFQRLMKTDYNVYYKGGNVSEKITDIIKDWFKE